MAFSTPTAATVDGSRSHLGLKCPKNAPFLAFPSPRLAAPCRALVPPRSYKCRTKPILSLPSLRAGAARPNPQGSYKYGKINITRTIRLASSAVVLNNVKHYAVNGISYFTPDTPLKLADHFKIPGVFTLGSIPDAPDSQPARFGTSVLSLDYKGFVEIIFINTESEVQSWHIDGYSFFAVGFGVNEQWTPNSRVGYNLVDAVSRSTVQVYPKGWSAVLMSLDNVGMWQIRSQSPQREYLGQQLYFRIFDNPPNTRTEALIPSNVLLCGQAVGKAR